MPQAGLRRLALADLDDDTLRQLVKHGEDLLVERKRAMPDPPKFGAAVASFANTLGGWVLLGVDDQGNVYGYPKPGKLDLQSHLADALRKQVDPLPPFVAAMRSYDGEEIAVVRVFESADTPHIVRGMGAVYVRTSKGKEPVDDHRTLVEIARRGERADADARSRLVSSTVLREAFVPPDAPPDVFARAGDADHVTVIVRAAPLTVTPQFADWPISQTGAQACYAAAHDLRNGWGDGGGSLDVEPRARGAIARRVLLAAPPDPASWGIVIAGDSLGVVGASLTQPKMPLVHLHVLRRETIRPLIDAVATLLEQAEAYGRALWDLWVCLPGDVVVHQATRLQPRRPDRERSFHVGGELAIPAGADERAALGRRWERELARTGGIKSWEGTADTD